jgi:hypothetical protein
MKKLAIDDHLNNVEGNKSIIGNRHSVMLVYSKVFAKVEGPL